MSSGRRYYGHQCGLTVVVDGDDLSCPLCHGDFLQAVNLPEPIVGIVAPDANSNPKPDVPRLSSFAKFLRNYLQAVLGEEIGLDFPPGGSIAGDQLIDRLAENDPNRLGTPPGAKYAVNSLIDVKISKAVIMAADSADCAVCREIFETETDAKQMPCGHVYHGLASFPGLLCTTSVRFADMSFRPTIRIMSRG